MSGFPLGLMRLAFGAGLVLVAACSASSGPSSAPAAAPTTSASTSALRAAQSATPSAATSATASRSPAVTGLTGHIVFTRAGDQYEDETLFVMKADATDEKQLTDYGHGGGPWASRDGAEIVFGTFGPDTQSRGTAAITDVSGSIPTILPLPDGTINLGSGPFSPDGTRIIREGWDDNNPAAGGIYLSNADGSAVRRLTKQHFIPGDWSPDGKHLLLFEGPDADTPPPGSLFVARSDGSDVRPLTPSGTRVQCCFNYHYSPDGKQVLFASPDGGLWTISADGSNLKEIFHDATGSWAITPSWSPDGSMIVFGLDDSANPFAHPHNGLYVARSDGSDVTLLLGDDNFKREPVWVAR